MPGHPEREDGGLSRYAAATIDHFQRPRNVGRLADADAVGRVDDPETETTISIYLKVVRGRVQRATFRTFGCSACVAASSAATELLVGASLRDAWSIDADALDRALGGLPADKRFCAELAARAVAAAVRALQPHGV